jgi:hypothetical protein
VSAVPWRIPTPLAQELGARLTGRLLVLTRQVARLGVVDGVFDLGGRQAARWWCCSPATGWRTLCQLEAAGAVTLLAPGRYEPAHSSVARWRLTDRLIRPVDTSRARSSEPVENRWSTPVGQSRKRDGDSRENATHISTSYLSSTNVAGEVHPPGCSCVACASVAAWERATDLMVTER